MYKSVDTYIWEQMNSRIARDTMNSIRYLSNELGPVGKFGLVYLTDTNGSSFKLFEQQSEFAPIIFWDYEIIIDTANKYRVRFSRIDEEAITSELIFPDFEDIFVIHKGSSFVPDFPNFRFKVYTDFTFIIND